MKVISSTLILGTNTPGGVGQKHSGFNSLFVR